MEKTKKTSEIMCQSAKSNWQASNAMRKTVLAWTVCSVVTKIYHDGHVKKRQYQNLKTQIQGK